MDKFVAQLVQLWFQWLKNDKKARDINLKMSQRCKAAEKCEEIINKKYEIISSINKYINEYSRT
jgi:hypothetical protein